MSGALTLALAALALVQRTDTVFAVDGADRLAVEAPGGSITVTAWNRPEVRIQASHSSRTAIEIRRRGSTIDVDAEARVGPATIVDYTISVPAGMDLDLEGWATRITVEGAEGEVQAETHQGDIRIVGGRGNVEVSSLTGSVVVERAQGRVQLDLTGGDGRVVDTQGEIYAENVGGSLFFENVRARAVEAGTVGGRIVYDGTLQSGGHYFFGSHGGSITIQMAPGSGATFHVATIHGSITADVPGAPEGFEKGTRHTFRTGDGGATVEAETFGGRITVTRRSAGRQERP